MQIAHTILRKTSNALFTLVETKQDHFKKLPKTVKATHHISEPIRSRQPGLITQQYTTDRLFN